MGFVLKTNCNMKPFTVFHFWEFQKQQQEDIAASPQYWARAAASKVVEQQASSKISNFPFWFSQNQKTNSILRKGFEIENSIAVMSSLNGTNKGPYKRSFWFQHLWPVASTIIPVQLFSCKRKQAGNGMKDYYGIRNLKTENASILLCKFCNLGEGHKYQMSKLPSNDL